MAVDSLRYVNLRPLLPVLALPILLPSGILRHTAENLDVRLSSSIQLGVAFSRRPLQESFRDGPLGRQDKSLFSCRSMLSDEYWQDGMKKFEDVRLQCSRDRDNVQESDLCRGSFYSSDISARRQAHYAKEANKTPALVDGTRVPLSLNRLRKQLVHKKLKEARDNKLKNSCAINETFASMILILRSLQIYTLPHFFQDDVQGLLSMVHREMQSSFLWLFQQVFACTPKLMVSVIILLTNFTVHSIERKVIRQNEATNCYNSRAAEPAFIFRSSEHSFSKKSDILRMCSYESNFLFRMTLPILRQIKSLEHASRLSELGSGNGNDKNVQLASEVDVVEEDVKYFQRKPMYAEEDTEASEMPSSKEAGSCEVADERKRDFTNERDLNSERLALDKIYCKITVAPVRVELELDDYVCYDLTDLAYQQALRSDSANPLLLANYAQFLYVVKHDHDRAQACFERAVKIDPSDSEAMSKFAKFLWLARRDRVAAERVYKSAIAVNPADPFHKGNFAHFLWHAQEEEKCQPTWSLSPSDL